MSAPTVKAANEYHAFVRGWRAGAARSSMCEKHLAHATLAEPYKAGYFTGMRDSDRAESAASERYGYDPSILREHEVRS